MLTTFHLKLLLLWHRTLQDKSQNKCFGKFTYNGIDRIDNSQGYIIDNVVPCCTKCNIAKGRQSIQEFKEWIYRAYAYLTKTETNEESSERENKNNYTLPL
jgi:hypothetical protein